MLIYKYLIIPIITSIGCQIIKVLGEYIKTKKISIERLLDGMGGMPSTHSTLVSSITTLIYIDYGLTSEIFSVTIIFSLIVIYDSMGIRYESSKMAKTINKLAHTNLKEKLGHTPIETLVGVIYGIITSIILNKLLLYI